MLLIKSILKFSGNTEFLGVYTYNNTNFRFLIVKIDLGIIIYHYSGYRVCQSLINKFIIYTEVRLISLPFLWCFSCKGSYLPSFINDNICTDIVIDSGFLVCIYGTCHICIKDTHGNGKNQEY